MRIAAAIATIPMMRFWASNFTVEIASKPQRANQIATQITHSLRLPMTASLRARGAEPERTGVVHSGRRCRDDAQAEVAEPLPRVQDERPPRTGLDSHPVHLAHRVAERIVVGRRRPVVEARRRQLEFTLRLFLLSLAEVVPVFLALVQEHVLAERGRVVPETHAPLR